MAHFESQVGATEVQLDDDVLDRIDKIVRPGTNVVITDNGYVPPALLDAKLRRRS
jgi:hypothetical protein